VKRPASPRQPLDEGLSAFPGVTPVGVLEPQAESDAGREAAQGVLE
jgi:hypothetical protein